MMMKPIFPFFQSLKSSVGLWLMFVLFPLTTSLFSCQKEVQVDIPAVEKHIVIQGQIEPNEYPFVLITRSNGYFDSVDSATVLKMFAFNAKVTVSDGVQSEVLKQVLDANYLPPLVYKASTLKGKSGGTYTLTVEVDGKVYTSTVTIPAAIGLDSLFFKPNPAPDSLGLIHARLSDPPGFGNYYRWFAKRINKDKVFLAPNRSVFDDRFVDGKSFSFDFVRGRDPNSSAADDTTRERRFFKKGDEIIVKFCTIPKAVFEFYKSYEMQITNNGNPFAAPATIKSNIQGGAIGIWAAYGTYIDTILAK